MSRILQVTPALYFNPGMEPRYPENSWWLQLPKFMQTLDDIIYRELEKVAKKRGISIQELIRAVIVPEWVAGYNGVEPKEGSSSKTNHWR